MKLRSMLLLALALVYAPAAVAQETRGTTPFSSLLTFTQNGTGAVATTFDLLYRGIIVTPEMFGDGVACSTASGAGIQKAYDYLGTVNRGRVMLTNCSYPFSGSLTMNKDGVSIEGQGGAYSTNTRIVFTPSGVNQCAINMTAGAGIISNAALRHLTIATADTTTYKTAICISDGSTTRLEDVFIRSFTGGTATAVTGAVASPSNEIRLTVAGASSNYNDGYAVMVGGVAGTVEANFGWPIVVSGGSTVDLKGSVFTNAFVSSVATFTGTGSGTNLTTSAVTGTINIGSMVTGTGVPANTLILSQTSGSVGGAGVYVTSNATTASAAALTSNAVIISSSTGLQTKGRELLTTEGLNITADLPLRMSKNPNFATSGSDTTTFNNLSLGSAFGTNSIAMIDDGAGVTSLNFTGTQSWGGGKSCLTWRDRSSPAINQQISIIGMRCEQAAIAGGWEYDIQPNNTTYSLNIINPLFSRTNGFRVRNTANLNVIAGEWLSTTGVCGDIDATVQNTQLLGNFWLAGSSTRSFVGQTVQSTSGKNPSTGCLPGTATYSTGTSVVTAPLVLSETTLSCPTCVLVSATAHGDSAYAILSTDRYVYTNAAFTAPRTWTLPAANSLSAGTTIWVQDAQNTVTSTNTLTVARAGADTINIGSTSLLITGAAGGITFTTDGVSNWGVPIQTVSTGGTGKTTLTSNGPLFGAGTNPIAAGTAGTNGQLMLGVTGSPGAFGTMSQDCTITNAGVTTCLKTNNVAFAGSATKVPYLARATATFTTDATSSTATVYNYKLTGGGGGGGGANAAVSAAGGGGAGGTCSGTFTGVAASTSVTITIGGGGTGGTAGNAGATGTSSTIAATGITTITATGGVGAAGTVTVGAGGVGGTCTTGTGVSSIIGGSGFYGASSATAATQVGGAGGGSLWGGGGSNGNGAVVAVGGNGTAFGGGGGGANAVGAGGNGAAGFAEVTWNSIQ